MPYVDFYEVQNLYISPSISPKGDNSIIEIIKIIDIKEVTF